MPVPHEATLKPDLKVLPQEVPPKAASSPSVANLNMVKQNFEYPYQFPRSCKGFLIQARNNIQVRASFVQGRVAEGEAPYFTLKPGVSYSQDNLDMVAPLIIFLAHSSGVPQTIEVISWV